MLNKIKERLIIIFILLTIFPTTIFAYSNKIIAGGESIGIEINTNGVLIAGFYNIGNINPGKDASLQKGDIITAVNNSKVSTIDEFIENIKNSNSNEVKITYVRNKNKYNTTLTMIKEDGVVKTGLYVKDSVTGIGTLSFIDPNTRYYGALGHEIIDNTTGIKLNVKDGKIYASNVTSIEKSSRGNPGSKRAITNSNDVYGNVNENTVSGIFGTYTKDFNINKLYNVVNYNEIKLGDAKILTVLNGKEKKEYDIKILRVNNNNDNKNILFEITDEELLNDSGGIVQGMSGSPIIQGNNIIGAVTNVIVNNPKRGYGILITFMLKEAEN